LEERGKPLFSLLASREFFKGIKGEIVKGRTEKLRPRRPVFPNCLEKTGLRLKRVGPRFLDVARGEESSIHNDYSLKDRVMK